MHCVLSSSTYFQPHSPPPAADGWMAIHLIQHYHIFMKTTLYLVLHTFSKQTQTILLLSWPHGSFSVVHSTMDHPSSSSFHLLLKNLCFLHAFQLLPTLSRLTDLYIYHLLVCNTEIIAAARELGL
jgi:hypothetical protein